MSGRTNSDDDVVRHQQEEDLGHEVLKPGGADRARASHTGSGKIGGEETGRDDEAQRDAARRRKPRQ
ncbi:hypothetical protein GRZ55_21165 [Chelativorans sp. ZYF759]|uniref:hypothetical protein n=1 Tax=Chelativorans sp. ZYF759 TaxID=2692213 RepID=UPI00145C963B|nr:hypothetical protein [Chelativorans sp. ZYF759]NMG41750.1 hypothetical protein [Chelativorans sp. ZYF759]